MNKIKFTVYFEDGEIDVYADIIPKDFDGPWFVTGTQGTGLEATKENLIINMSQVQYIEIIEDKK